MRVHPDSVLGSRTRQPQQNDHLCHLPIRFSLQQNITSYSKKEGLEVFDHGECKLSLRGIYKVSINLDLRNTHRHNNNIFYLI